MATKMFESAEFQIFYERYPRKTHRDEAWAAWRKLEPNAMLLSAIMEDIETRVWPENRDYIPNPATYLNKRRWLDEKSDRVVEMAPRRMEKHALADLKQAHKEALAASGDQRRANLAVLRKAISIVGEKGIQK